MRSSVHPVLALSLLVLAACGKSNAEASGSKRLAPLVSVTRVEQRDVAVELHAPVDLRPLEQADVGSKVLGYLDAVFVDRGDRVKKGQTLAVVRPSDLPDQLAAARGAQAEARATVARARADADRAHQLAPKGVVAQAELEHADSAVASAEATQRAADAQTAALAIRLGETKLESPLDGVVVQRRLDSGALVGPPGGGSVLTIARTDVLRVFITVGERDASAVSVGQEAHVELDALPGKSFGGKVVRLAPAFDPTTRTLEAEVQLPNPDGELRPGMYGRGALVLAVHPHAAVVAADAVQISDRKRYVFVVEQSKAVRRPVETGVDGGEWLEIVAGLSPGDEVVVAGADGLSDGAPVRVARPGDAPDAGAKAKN